MAESFKEAQRSSTGLLTAVERRALVWLAGRMPAAVNSDHLTGLALFSMCDGRRVVRVLASR